MELSINDKWMPQNSQTTCRVNWAVPLPTQWNTAVSINNTCHTVHMCKTPGMNVFKNHVKIIFHQIKRSILDINLFLIPALQVNIKGKVVKHHQWTSAFDWYQLMARVYLVYHRLMNLEIHFKIVHIMNTLLFTSTFSLNAMLFHMKSANKYCCFSNQFKSVSRIKPFQTSFVSTI